MSDPVLTLLSQIEREINMLPAPARLEPAAAGAALDERLAREVERPVPAGVAAYYRAYDGGTLPVRDADRGGERASVPESEAEVPGGDGAPARRPVRSPSASTVRLLSFEESLDLRLQERDLPRGLWPIARHVGRILALDTEVPVGTEWPVLQLFDRNADRVGTSLLRFLAVVSAELAAPAHPDADLELARERCRRDPHLSEHWVELAEALAQAGRLEEAVEVLAEGSRCADPLGPSLLAAIGLEAMVAGDLRRGRVALEDALSCEPQNARDDDARLDAAAHLLVLAIDAGDTALAQRSRSVLLDSSVATAGYWRAEAVRGLGTGDGKRGELALRVVETLVPGDPDVPRLRAGGIAVDVAVRASVAAREALEAGDIDQAVADARRAVGALPELGWARAQLAEALNAIHADEALAEARAATVQNPHLVEAWRELGDAELNRRAFDGAVAAYDEALARDPGYGLLLAKRAQALLEQGRRIEALENVQRGSEAGGDGFFLSAVKGDVLAAMERHAESAQAYEQALLYEPDDHWALHQAALEHGAAGEHDRAVELFQLALDNDHDGCHQTLVDFAQLMRRIGRIGDAVRLYRRAVAAAPSESQWRQGLKEAEKELAAAPN